MKKIALQILLLIGYFSIAQNSGSITLNWTVNKEVAFSDSSVMLPFFEGDSYNYNEREKAIHFVKKINVTRMVNESSLVISNPVYETVSAASLTNLDLNLIPSALDARVENLISRDIIKAVLVVNPFVKEGGTYKKLVKFDYTFSFNNNRLLETNNSQALTNSVLQSGDWYRFYVEKSGAYKITKSFLQSLGINTSSINPAKIKIYGHGGRMAPLSNNVSYPMDPEENAIQVVGEEDGKFDDADYIVFYAEGMDNWSDENKTHLNVYADRAYYYITVDGANGKRMLPLSQPTGTATTLFTTYDDYAFHETDQVNIGRLGRIWYGESFSIDNSQEFTFSFPNQASATQPQLKVHVGGNSVVTTNFKIYANGQLAGQLNLGALTPNGSVLVSDSTLSTPIAGATSYTIKLDYDNGAIPTSKAYLDYISIKAKSNLAGYGKQFRFQNDASATGSGVAEYQISNAGALNQVWDITDIYNASKLENTQTSLSFKSNLGVLRKYIAVDFNDLYTPLKENNTRVPNQNLKGTVFLNSQGAFEDIDYLIVCPSFLNAQAQRLADFHRNYSGLNTKVINLETIYAEFCTGKQDIGAIRNFVKYVYQNASSPAARVKYLNLFGDASYDFKDRISNNTNIVPIFHATSGITSGESSFASDDFFTMMDTNEGSLEFGGYGNGSDIAVGRMIVSTSQQADEMVDKVIDYYDLKSYGSWRNNYVCIADDADSPSDASLQARQNSLADIIYQQKPFINYKKILLDSYQQQTSAGGDRYPQVNDEIQNAFEKGALVFNYLGHGGEDGLTGERIWDKFDGSNFNNRYRYPLFITITCEFSRFDNPLRPTAGEYTYWNPKGGAVSMITTIRSIGQGNAEIFNDNLAEHLFSYGSNTYPSIAEALRLAKNDSNNNSSTRVVFYLGDPALKLAIPQPQVVLTKVNDIPLSQPIPDFQALAYIKLSGEVQDENGNLISGYNGELAVNVFDKNIIRTTLNNDGNSPAISFNNLGETIFRGNASVTNGLFEFGFVVPKDIRIAVNNGRISFYAKRNQILLDKTGYNTDIKIGGIDTNAVTDTTPPRVRLYMNDETFVNGGITNESPFFLAFLEDEHGINTASGIGHDIVAILDGDESNPFVLNDYYETELDDYTKGKIRYPFRNLALGLHTITFKAWDVYNNFITAEIQFVVVGDDTVTLTNVLNYPNPFVSYTQFWFTHNKPYEPLDVQVQIFTITGKVVKTINQSVTTDGFLSREISWDGKDDFGDKIGKGVYVYKLTVKSTLTGEQTEKTEKLVIL